MTDAIQRSSNFQGPKGPNDGTRPAEVGCRDFLAKMPMCQLGTGMTRLFTRSRGLPGGIHE